MDKEIPEKRHVFEIDLGSQILKINLTDKRYTLDVSREGEGIIIKIPQEQKGKWGIDQGENGVKFFPKS